MKQKTLTKIDWDTLPEEKGPYELPEGWKWVKFSSIIDWSKPYPMKRGPFGSAIKKSFFVPKGKGTFKVYEQKHAINKDASIGTYYINKSKYEELKAFSVSPGDAIISCSGTIGKVFILSQNIEQGIVNQALLKITLNYDLILPSFFVYLFETYVIKMGGIPKSQGMAIKNIPGVKILKEILIPLPTLETQKQIVAKIEEVFSRVDKAIKLREEALNKTEKLFQMALEEVFREAKEDKEGWKWVRLGDFSDLIRGLTFNKKDISSNTDSTIKIITANHIKEQNIDIITHQPIYINLSNFNEEAKIKKNDIIMVMSTGSRKALGRVCFINKTYSDIFIGGFLSIIRSYKNLEPKFLYYLFLSNSFRKEFNKFVGANINNISKRRFLEIIIPLPFKNDKPDLEKQKQIVERLDKLNEKIKKMKGLQQIELEKLKELKEQVLYKAFRGQLI